jgi:hypothetical protein
MNAVTAAQLAQVTFVAGGPGTSDDLNVKVFDGHTYTNWSEFHVCVGDIYVEAHDGHAYPGWNARAHQSS